MAKAKKTVFFCQNCGYESAKWMGQCPGCREVEFLCGGDCFTGCEKSSGQAAAGSPGGRAGKPVKLSEIDIREDNRVKTGMDELDRVLGGGVVQGSMVLVGGDPGIGKSTLLLQVCKLLSESGA